MTMPSSSPIAQDRATRTFASPPCTACHLPHSSALSSTKRGLYGSPQDLQCRVSPPHALGLRSTGTRAEAVLANPSAAVPDVTAGAGATTPDAADPVDDRGARAVVSVLIAAAAVVIADTRPALSAAATVSVAAAGVVVPVSIAAAVSVAAAGAGVPISAAAAVSVVATGVGIPVSAAAAVSVAATGASAPISAATVRAPSMANALDTDSFPTGSSASSSRSITSPSGGTPGAAPCPTGSAAEVEGGTGVGPCPVPDCGTLPPVTAAEAASAGGPTASPTTPLLAAAGVTAHPTEVVDTRSAFFGASGGTKSRGAAL
ncbi:angiomotin-like [Setaria italica]|uniref:angiomotin-like n=1 Tax=Setaria italica TaxID=4555 RepID=UPI000350F8F4|nr:angiomotin-like [Setaria italica]